MRVGLTNGWSQLIIGCVFLWLLKDMLIDILIRLIKTTSVDEVQASTTQNWVFVLKVFVILLYMAAFDFLPCFNWLLYAFVNSQGHSKGRDSD